MHPLECSRKKAKKYITHSITSRLSEKYILNNGTEFEKG